MAPFFLTSCMQIDTTVKLNRDGSAVITERMRFSRFLLELDGQQKAAARSYTRIMSPEAAKERLQKMGKGVTLVSHKIQAAPAGAREAIVVYEIPDLQDLVYMSPFLELYGAPGKNRIRFEMKSVLGPSRRVRPGSVVVQLVPLAGGKQPAQETVAKKRKEKPKPISPQALQTYRDLAPVFRDLMQDFHVRLRFQTYCPIKSTSFHSRNSGVRNGLKDVHFVDLLSFSWRDLDKWGGRILKNEELMLDLLRRDLGTKQMVDTVRNFVTNNSLPVFLPLGSPHRYFSKTQVITFPPSRPLFERYYQGKKLDFGNSKAPEVVTADFAKIGYHKERGKK